MEKKAKVIVVTSGKGGVGKTTSSASIGAGLAAKGYKTVVIDFDVGLRNLDLLVNVENRVVYDFIQVIMGECKLKQALVSVEKVSGNLFILPASQTRDKEHLSEDGVIRVIDELKKDFDYILCDSPAGIESGAKMAMLCADVAVIVTNPEVSSVRDSDRIIGHLDSHTIRSKTDGMEPVKKHLLITRYNPDRVGEGQMLSYEQIEKVLYVDFIGVIPESPAVLDASNTGVPIIMNTNDDAGQAYLDVVDRLLGEDKPHDFLTPKKKGLFKMLFGGNRK